MNKYLTVFLYILYTILSMSTTAILKKTQQGIKMTFFHVVAINLVNSIFGAACFYILGKFHISVSPVILIYALIFSLFVSGNMILQIIVYSRISIALSSLLNTCGVIILSAAFGIFVFEEPFSLQLLIAIALLITAVFLPGRKMLSANGGMVTFLICVFWICVAAGMSIFSKIYSTDARLTDTNSMFFFTNVFSFINCSLIFLIGSIKNGSEYMRGVSKDVFCPRVLIPMGINTIPTNGITLVGVILLRYMPLSVHSILTSSMVLIGAALLSLTVFKERLTRDNYISIILAIIAIILRN